MSARAASRPDMADSETAGTMVMEMAGMIAAIIRVMEIAGTMAAIIRVMEMAGTMAAKIRAMETAGMPVKTAGTMTEMLKMVRDTEAGMIMGIRVAAAIPVNGKPAGAVARPVAR